jgi:hypothetical protein
MKSKRTFSFSAVKAAGSVIIAGVIVLGTLCVTLLVMVIMVTTGTVFAVALPYKPIAALTALAALGSLIASSVKRWLLLKKAAQKGAI